ncbi:hypothetical protein [Bradyrhizobium sp. CCH5-F6]|jgi:hypothetical protein|uniref:hypothetical protein n=1 Tax=Bradyrhizobium sp. CCH5-F6 TaxID=1768753 RepID=UPI000AB947D6|nr:hypothetical protein [Bradyrhizobium sp. CCH5-F6]
MHGMFSSAFGNDSPCRSELVVAAVASEIMKIAPAVGINAVYDCREFGTSW